MMRQGRPASDSTIIGRLVRPFKRNSQSVHVVRRDTSNLSAHSTLTRTDQAGTQGCRVNSLGGGGRSEMTESTDRPFDEREVTVPLAGATPPPPPPPPPLSGEADGPTTSDRHMWAAEESTTSSWVAEKRGSVSGLQKSWVDHSGEGAIEPMD